MAGIKVNLALAAETIPNGIYKLRIENCEQKYSQASEHPYLVCTVPVSDGDFAGFRLTDMTSLSPNAAFRLADFLRAAGMEVPEDVKALKEFEFDPRDLFGTEVLAIVMQETYNERT